jgi:hypothetical protein
MTSSASQFFSGVTSFLVLLNALSHSVDISGPRGYIYTIFGLEGGHPGLVPGKLSIKACPSPPIGPGPEAC